MILCLIVMVKVSNICLYCYTKDLTRIDQILVRMFGTSGDGIHDCLLHFVTAVDGAYFFTPSEHLLEEVLEG